MYYAPPRCAKNKLKTSGHLTDHDVFPNDLDPLVSVRAGVLVPESNHVTQLVNHDTKLVAVLPDGDGLRSIASLAHKGATPGGNSKIMINGKIK